MKHNSCLAIWVTLLALVFLISACGKPTVASSEIPTPTPSLEPLPSATPTLPVELFPTPDSYGYIYEPGTKPRFPPASSVSMPIWDMTLPNPPIDGEPRFVSFPLPEPLADPIALLEEAGCHVENGNDAVCETDSPLAAFGCEFIRHPAGIYPNLEMNGEIVGTCYSVPPVEDQPRDAYLFRVGCAFRRNAAYIVKVEGQYELLGTADALKAFFGPIESREEALSYAQLMTGLVAHFTFEYDADLLYFQEEIEGTRVTETDDGYRVNLFHFARCFCEPWVNSEVEIFVDRSGNVTWLDAIPISMTTGFSCVD